MRKICILLTLCLLAAGCKKVTVNFTYSPDAPRAGQSVAFTNLSSSGEDWEWTFGDGTTSTLKSPSHTYRKPGTYLVQLKVDKKNYLRASKNIVVYDTVPTFVANDTTFEIYKDYTFTANVYNPYNYEVTYTWTFPSEWPYVVYDPDNSKGNSITCYFTTPMKEAPVCLTVELNGEKTEIKKTFPVSDKATNSLLIRNSAYDFRQRIFGTRAAEPLIDASAKEMLDLSVDTVELYSGHMFYLSELQVIFPELQGFHIANRKLYYRTDDGLWVANIDGAYPVQIDERPCLAMVLDKLDNRIYWANNEGVWYMPFIGSDNNKFVTEPTQLNTIPGVTRLAADNEPK